MVLPKMQRSQVSQKTTQYLQSSKDPHSSLEEIQTKRNAQKREE